MPEVELYPRLRAAVRVDANASVGSVALGDRDLQFRGVPNALLVDVLSRFNGRDTLANICAVYPKNVDPVVRLIASKMEERGMLLLSRDSRDRWDTRVPPAAQSTWTFLADRLADPAEAFRRWRREPIIVSGHGRGFGHAVIGLINTGAGSLRIGAEASADREELDLKLARHAQKDEEFSYVWTDVRSETGETALLLHIVDEDPFAHAGEWAVRALSHRGPRILAGVTAGWGVVLRLAAGGAVEPPFLPPAPSGSEVGVSDYATAVIGSMAAFQALNAVMTDEQAQTSALLSEKVFVRPDGGLYVSARAPAPALAPDVESAAGTVEDGPRSPHQRERERWIDATRPFFAAPAPLLAWEDEMALPTFPLAHRALSILPDHGDRARLLTRWAVLPSEVTALTLGTGVSALADTLTGEHGHAVGLSTEEWSKAAFLAWAESRAPGELIGSSERRLEYRDSDDVRFRTLVRLINLYCDAPPEIAISLDRASGAPRADVTAGAFRRHALGASVVDAAVEALGRALSGMQLGEPPRLFVERTPEPVLACRLAVSEKSVFDPERRKLAPLLLDRLGGVPVAGFVLGRYVPVGGDD